MSMLPIIEVTAEDQASERRVLDLGASDYRVKPFDLAVLVARVNAVFNRALISAA